MSSPTWLDQPAPVREKEELDEAKLAAYLDAQLPGPTASLRIQQFPRGFSNLTYLVERGNDAYVLRRPPFGANIKSAHDMGREYRILSHLHPVYPKAPRAVLSCEDDTVLGAPFYLMERVEGVILRAAMPADMHPTPDVMYGIADSLVTTLAELHQVDYETAGLGELGRPHGYVQRQVEGWIKRYEKAKTDTLPAMEQAAVWLASNQPTTYQHTLIHNDFKYDNMVLDADDWTKVIAVLDWEMCTLGDPMMDLGTSLGYWLDPEDPPALQALRLSPTTLPGNPGRRAIAEKYAEARGANLDHLVFYYTFGLYKIAVIVQQIYARYKKGYTQDPRFANLIEGVRACSMLAARAIEKNRIDHLF